jgi:hypothetical protein
VTSQALNAGKLLDVVTHFYLRSNDFNGISAQQLSTAFGTTWEALYEPLCQLIEDERAGVLYADTALNSHIIRLGFEPKDVQVRKLKTADLHHTCIYPRPTHLNTVVKPTDYASRPYCLALALGEPQLAFRAFDLSVLEIYRNDPRYYYSTSDIGGKICIKTEAYQSSDFPESDKVLLESFGFAYDDDYNRAVAAYRIKDSCRALPRQNPGLN